MQHIVHHTLNSCKEKVLANFSLQKIEYFVYIIVLARWKEKLSKCSEKSAAVEKGHQGKFFEAEAEGRGREMFRDALFLPRQVFLSTRTLFSHRARKIM